MFVDVNCTPLTNYAFISLQNIEVCGILQYR